MKITLTAPSWIALGGYQEAGVVAYRACEDTCAGSEAGTHNMWTGLQSRWSGSLRSGQSPLAVRIEKGTQGSSMVGGC